MISFIQYLGRQREGVLFPGSRYLADPKTINKCLKGLLELSILDPEWAWRLIKINRRSDEPGEKRIGESCTFFKGDPNSILSETLFRVERVLKFVVFLLSCWRIRTETFKNDACVRRSRSWREMLKKNVWLLCALNVFAYLLKKTIPLSEQLFKAACESRRPFRLLFVPALRKERLLFWNSKIARS